MLAPYDANSLSKLPTTQSQKSSVIAHPSPHPASHILHSSASPSIASLRALWRYGSGTAHVVRSGGGGNGDMDGRRRRDTGGCDDIEGGVAVTVDEDIAADGGGIDGFCLVRGPWQVCGRHAGVKGGAAAQRHGSRAAYIDRCRRRGSGDIDGCRRGDARWREGEHASVAVAVEKRIRANRVRENRARQVRWRRQHVGRHAVAEGRAILVVVRRRGDSAWVSVSL
jgi:hypothetical protein